MHPAIGRSFPSPSVDSEDIDRRPKESPISSKNSPVWKQLLQRLNPAHCLAPATNCFAPENVASCMPLDHDEPADFDSLMPQLAKDMREGGKGRTAALQQLYRLTDRDRKFNRIPLVCTTKYDIFGVVAPCLSLEVTGPDRRQALLLVNNLCIPMENKATILLDVRQLELVVQPLMRILKERLPESYLAAVCLFNLSYHDEGKTNLLLYTPEFGNRTTYLNRPVGDDPDSLVRILEAIITDYAPYCLQQPQVHSVQAEAVRWSMAIMRNLVMIYDNALFVSKETEIPTLAAQFLAETNTDDLGAWAHDSLPDSCLMLMVHLAQFDQCLKGLDTPLTRTALKRLKGKGGIHEMRSSAIVLRIDGKQSFVSLAELEEKME